MEIKEYAEKIGFSLIKGIYVKEIDNYILYLGNWDYFMLTIPSIFIPLKGKIQNIKELEQVCLNNACGKLKLDQKDEILIVSLPEGKKDEKFIEKVNEIIRRLLTYLKNRNYTKKELCPLCLQKAEYNLFLQNYVPMHQNCYNSYKNEMLQIKPKYDFKFYLSIVLSLICSFIGLIPCYFLMKSNLNYFSGLLVLCPLLSILPSLLLKADRNKILKLTTSLIPLILIISFTVYSMIYIVNNKPISWFNFFFQEGLVGLRKAIFNTILAFGGLGINKIISSLKKDNHKIFELLSKDNEVNK